MYLDQFYVDELSNTLWCRTRDETLFGDEKEDMTFSLNTYLFGRGVTSNDDFIKNNKITRIYTQSRHRKYTAAIKKDKSWVKLDKCITESQIHHRADYICKNHGINDKNRCVRRAKTCKIARTVISEYNHEWEQDYYGLKEIYENTIIGEYI